MPAIHIKSREHYIKAIKVLDRVGGTWQGVGRDEKYLLVSPRQFEALVEAKVVARCDGLTRITTERKQDIVHRDKESPETHAVSQLAWERMVTAVEKVQERMRRAVAALEQAKIPYAVIGGNAVAAWVSEVDESAVRITRDVDILLRRADLERAKDAMAKAGFIYRHVKSIDMFLDGPGARARDAVHVIFAGEKVRPEDPVPAPDVTEAKVTATMRTVSLEALVRMKLVAFRDKDRTHIRDMIDVGLVDGAWCAQLPAVLAERLQSLLDTPEG